MITDDIINKTELILCSFMQGKITLSKPSQNNGYFILKHEPQIGNTFTFPMCEYDYSLEVKNSPTILAREILKDYSHAIKTYYFK